MGRVARIAGAVAVGAYLFGLTGRLGDLESELAELRRHIEETAGPLVIARHAALLESCEQRLWDVEDLLLAVSENMSFVARDQRVRERVGRHGSRRDLHITIEE
jgi:hypothetical protein